ncbi:hypothetical protein WA026_018211 [Henosepilachna vigintioctopunctata]|uniref:Dendritic cell-specific transmembrane protein-like domain-containing protein n=1 Tax=Henosepilachna vigintioctopunctata TaxID=420089 RepID=A0AAW1VH12_9CUCU
MSLLMTTSLKIAIQMGLDYSLYWIMMLIRKYGKFQSKVQTPNIPTIHIAGNGLLADLLKGIVKSFQPLGISLEIDTVPCLPTPLPPDTDRYIQIASILFACLIFTIFEPYGLRWRHSILCYYYPKRAKERAIWLYNHILRSRSSFLKFARRQLRRKVLGTKKIAKVTCIEFLRSKTDNKCLLLFLGSDKQRACLFCGEIFRKSDKEDPIECQRPGCTAIYCRQCFEDLENVCTVCLAPIEYGDNSDMSEEKDSSDEDFAVTDFDSGEDDDSGRSTEEEGSSTDDYSYGYQESEKQPSDLALFKTQSSKDLEEQYIPDYASMQTFDDETDYDEESDEDITDQQLSGVSGRSYSSATSFQKARAEHKRSLRRRLKRKCPCLTLKELSDLHVGLSSNGEDVSKLLKYFSYITEVS